MLAQHGNRVCTITENDIQKYFDMGYSILDDNGNVIKSAIPDDITSLKAECVKLNKENNALKDEIKSLKEELEKAKPVTTTNEPKRRKKTDVVDE